MRSTRLGIAVLVLGALLALTYLAAGILGGLLIDWEDDGGDQSVWVVVLIVAGALLLAGLYFAERSRWLAATLLAVGAIVGAVVIFWSVVLPLAAAALVVLAIVWARRATPAPS